MKVLYVTRLFSGLAASVEQRSWRPAGVPTIYKMVEGLDSRHEARFLLLPKGGFKQPQAAVIKLPPLKSDFHILSSEHAAPPWLGRRLGIAWREWVQAWQVLKEIDAFKPDLLYVDHANVLIAALVAHFSKRIRVVFRLMGCFGIKTSFAGNKPMLRLYRWGYRSPFAAVICTQEGSNSDYWLTRALDAKVPRHVLLNGVDAAPATLVPDPRLQALPQHKTIVTAIGRLDRDKAADKFLQAFLSAWQRDKDHLHALLIGIGALKAAMLAAIKEAGAEQAVTFIENLPHEQIAAAHRCTDIYVSLNRAGNLSNANLEAMQAGLCMIIPASQPDGTDAALDALLSDRAVVRIPNPDDVPALAEAIYRLHLDPVQRTAMSAQLTQESGQFLYSWEQRIQKEMALLEGLVNK